MSLNKHLSALSALLIIPLLHTPARSAEPKPIRENIEWCDIWVSGADKSDLPRVLLIGDSITRGYYSAVEKKLAGKAYAARVATSRCVVDPVLTSEIALVMGQVKFDVVHFNNGMHGWGYSEEDYKRNFPELLAVIRKYAPHAKLIWAATTPVRVSGKLDELNPRTDRVKVRNAIVHDYMAKENIPTDDLFSLVEKHPEYYSSDGTHFNQQGTTTQAEQVAQEILKLLK